MHNTCPHCRKTFHLNRRTKYRPWFCSASCDDAARQASHAQRATVHG